MKIIKTQEELDLYVMFKIFEYKYNNVLEDKNYKRYNPGEQLFIQRTYEFLLKYSELKPDKKYIPQYDEEQECKLDEKNIFLEKIDTRKFSIGEKVFVNIPEDAGKWSDYYKLNFAKEGIVESISEDEGLGFDLDIRFEDGTVKQFLSRQVNKL